MKVEKLHPLRKSASLCNDFYTVDIETGRKDKKGIVKWCLDARPERFVFAVVYGFNYSQVVYSIKELRALFLTKRFKGKTVFAHNGGGYDYICIYGNPYDFDREAIFNGKFISFTNGNCTFGDSMNIFVGVGIEYIGKLMGKQKQGMTKNFDYTETNWNIKSERDRAINGCYTDCQILWDALHNVFEFTGEIKITQASLSMAYYRRFHQPFRIDHNSHTKTFWDSYYGGRCEAFQMGKTKSRVIDINSSYPHKMKTLKFPNPKFLKREKNISISLFKNYLKWYEGCAKVSVLHNDTTFGFLPFKSEGKLLFPTGKFSGTWTFLELRFALEKKAIKILQIKDVVYSEPLPSIFVTFVDTLNEMKIKAKEEGNLFEEDRAKRFSNSNYGKWAQRITEQNIYISDIYNKQEFSLVREAQKKKTFIKLVTFNRKRNDAFLVVKIPKEKKAKYAIPSFASYITSAGRIHLLEKMLELENQKIVYCDTDSIFFEGKKKIKSEKHLGGWKLENKIVTDIKGLKNYRYIDMEKNPDKDIWKVKGVPVDKGKKTKIFDDYGNSKEVPSVEQIGKNSFRYFNLVKTKESLRRNLEAGVIIERLKTIKNTYDKRVVFKNGKTKPIKLCSNSFIK